MPSRASKGIKSDLVTQPGIVSAGQPPIGMVSAGEPRTGAEAAARCQRGRR
jgi:hypothetical protein